MASAHNFNFIDSQLCPFKFVIFDVDGTLVDSFSLFIGLLNQFAPKYRYPTLDTEKIEQLRTLAPKEIRKALNLSTFNTIRLMLDCKKQAQQVASPEPFEGIKELLFNLKQHHVKLGIVTSNSKLNCQRYLGEDLLALFDWVECDASIYGKQRKIKKLIQKSKLPLEDIIYIGDQIIDIRSAHHNGISAGAVTWGFNHQRVLIKENPHYCFEHVNQLSTILVRPAMK